MQGSVNSTPGLATLMPGVVLHPALTPEEIKGPPFSATSAQALPTGSYGSKFLALKDRYRERPEPNPNAPDSAYRIQAQPRTMGGIDHQLPAPPTLGEQGRPGH